MSEGILLYHAGHGAIPSSDIRYGRKNADFGQGFYLSDDFGFASRWAKERRGSETVLNRYAFEPDGLSVLRFERDEEWFDYIFRNRAGEADVHPEADVIVGPIANDTLFRTFGILTSGVLEPAESLRLLRIGPVYEQTVLKTEKAASHLRWIGAERIPDADLKRYREALAAEEAAYQTMLAKVMETAER